MTRLRKSTVFGFLFALTFVLIAVPRALAQQGTNGYAASPFATGFAVSKTGGAGAGFEYGPIGLAFDSSGMLLVMDPEDGYLYKFGPGGGVASSATRVNTSPIDGQPWGLAFSNDWRLYLARLDGDVVELDPSTGIILRTVANISGAAGIATDPLSGDLFVSDIGSTIFRISNYANGPGTVTRYVSSLPVDGLMFTPDGTLYVAVYPTAVAKISGTNSATPGVVTHVIDVPTADGIAIATDLTFLLVNRNDGKITKVDLTTSPAKLTDIFTGGSRGDFIAVGPDGCLYATQSASIIKVTNADGSCSLAPTGPVVKAAENDFINRYAWILALCIFAAVVGGLGIFVFVILVRRRKET